MRQWVFGVDPVFVDRPEKLPALAARQLPILQAGSDNDLDEAFASLARLSASGPVIGQDAFFIGRSKQIAALALHHSAPANRVFDQGSRRTACLL
jgi:hypothetical protein